jgi:hypothetical protein
VLLLMGAGIGLTPFAAVMREATIRWSRTPDICALLEVLKGVSEWSKAFAKASETSPSVQLTSLPKFDGTHK